MPPSLWSLSCLRNPSCSVFFQHVIYTMNMALIIFYFYWSCSYVFCFYSSLPSFHKVPEGKELLNFYKQHNSNIAYWTLNKCLLDQFITPTYWTAAIFGTLGDFWTPKPKWIWLLPSANMGFGMCSKEEEKWKERVKMQSYQNHMRPEGRVLASERLWTMPCEWRAWDGFVVGGRI